ncbi:MAG: hypothetical protein P8J68_06580 [Arenicellaceae bacterium]|nr:hypothetical protein [Arenicellaceae bacterium]
MSNDKGVWVDEPELNYFHLESGSGLFVVHVYNPMMSIGVYAPKQGD